MKTRTFTMAVLAAGVALMLSAQAQAQVVFPKVISATTGAVANITIGTTSGNAGTAVSDKATLNVAAQTCDAGKCSLSGTTCTTAADCVVAGTQNDITVNDGSSNPPLTIPEGRVCSIGTPPPGNGSGLPCQVAGDCAANTCQSDMTCSVDSADCSTTPCVQQTCELSGAPGCVVNPAIHKEATQFVYLPRSPTSTCCDIGSCPGSCTGIRGIVLSLKNTNAIADGSTLYTCKIDIASTAANNSAGYPLVVPAGSASASDPHGKALATTSTDGAVIVPAIVTATSSPTITPVPTNTAAVPPTSTGTATRTARPTFSGGGGNDDDACAIASPANSNAGWMLLLPAAALLWIRRRSR